MKRLVFLVLIVILIIVSIGAVPASACGGYRVRRGDTLYGIARRYGVSVTALARANGLSRWSWVYTGQYLTIPGSCGAPAPPPRRGPGYRPAPGRAYIVRWGDTLYGIARRYGVSVARLAQANGLTTHSWVYAGQYITIPW